MQDFVLDQEVPTWGGAEILRGEPPISVLRDALYMPSRHGEGWGLYDRGGIAHPATIEHIIYWNADSFNHVNYEARQPLARSRSRHDTPRVRGVHIYLGRPNMHFGHFILDNLSRFWATARLMRRHRGAKLLLHEAPGLESDFSLPWFKSLLTGMGLTRSDFIWYDRPSRLEKVYIPHPGLVPQAYAYEGLGNFLRKLGDRIAAPSPPNPRLAYLSKTGMTAGVSRVSNEAAVVQVLANAGVDIVFPETLSLPEQIGLFNSRRTIIGMVGSSFHVSLLSRAVARLICVDPVSSLNSNYLLSDKISGSKTIYLGRTGTISEGAQDGFLASFKLLDPEDVARSLLDAAGWRGVRI